MDGMRLPIAVAAASVAVALVLAGCGPDTERVVGRLLDVKSSGVLTLESVEILDEQGRLWLLEGPGDFGHLTPSHLRGHMVLGEQVEVTFHRAGDRLVIDRLGDYP
jgi:predicted small secreted protein